MKTAEKIRFSVAAQQAVKSTISEQVGVEILELDTNAPIGLGSFSKPRTKVADFYSTIESARKMIVAGEKSDLLVAPAKSKDSGWGWQVIERRQDCAGRVATCGGDSRMPRTSCGAGRIYLL